jgi:glycosyltransferase involved in cell wall biosynthesis
MKITIILTTINRYTKLLNCIDSILNNTQKKIDLILIDQNISPDFLLQKTTKVKYIHEGEIGKSRALNIGISKAQGDIIAFIDELD